MRHAYQRLCQVLLQAYFSRLQIAAKPESMAAVSAPHSLATAGATVEGIPKLLDVISLPNLPRNASSSPAPARGDGGGLREEERDLDMDPAELAALRKLAEREYWEVDQLPADFDVDLHPVS